MMNWSSSLSEGTSTTECAIPGRYHQFYLLIKKNICSSTSLCAENVVFHLFQWHLVSTYYVPDSACSWHLEGYCGWRSREGSACCSSDCVFVWISEKPALQVDPVLQARRSHKEASPPPGRGNSSPQHMAFGVDLSPNFTSLTSYSCAVNDLLLKAALSRNRNSTLLLLGETFNLPLTTCLSSWLWPYTLIRSLTVQCTGNSLIGQKSGWLRYRTGTKSAALNTLPICLRFWVNKPGMMVSYQ